MTEAYGALKSRIDKIVGNKFRVVG